MEMWIWLSGIAGSPGNNGWIEVLGFSQPRIAKTVSISIGPDPAASQIFEKCARGDLIPRIVLALGPQAELHYTQSMITAASFSPRGGQMSFQFAYETVTRKYSGAP